MPAYISRLTMVAFVLVLVLLELIAKNGFTPRAGSHSDFGGRSGPRQRQTPGEETRPEPKPSDASKPYTSDQLEAVRRSERLTQSSGICSYVYMESDVMCLSSQDKTMQRLLWDSRGPERRAWGRAETIVQKTCLEIPSGQEPRSGGHRGF